MLAHHHPRHFRRAVAYFLAAGTDIFVHVDARSDQKDFSIDDPRVRFLSERRKILWGGFSIIDATLNLIREAKSAKGYDSYTLVSGDCFGLRSPAEFAAALKRNKNILRSNKVEEGAWNFQRISVFYLPDSALGSFNRLGPPLVRKLDKSSVDQVREAVQIMDSRAAFIAQYGYFKGPQWWSLTAESIEYVLDFILKNEMLCEAFPILCRPG